QAHERCRGEIGAERGLQLAISWGRDRNCIGGAQSVRYPRHLGGPGGARGEARRRHEDRRVDLPFGIGMESDNLPAWSGRRGHYEVWFLTMSDGAAGYWIRSTTLAPDAGP